MQQYVMVLMSMSVVNLYSAELQSLLCIVYVSKLRKEKFLNNERNCQKNMSNHKQCSVEVLGHQTSYREGDMAQWYRHVTSCSLSCERLMFYNFLNVTNII